MNSMFSLVLFGFGPKIVQDSLPHMSYPGKSHVCSCKYLLETFTTDCHIKFFTWHSEEKIKTHGFSKSNRVGLWNQFVVRYCYYVLYSKYELHLVAYLWQCIIVHINVLITINYYYRTGFCKAQAHTVTDEHKSVTVWRVICRTSSVIITYCN